jgi:DNA/RNA endonuclease G (NUC1)
MLRTFLVLLLFTSASASALDWRDKLKDKASDALSAAKGFVSQDKQIELDYGGFTVFYGCERRGYNYVSYVTVPDSGEHSRYEPFHHEPRLAMHGCLPQKSTKSYRKAAGQEQYHRGHGIHQNILDHDLGLMKKSNAMTNIVPHHGVQNVDGLWRKLEMRIECARDATTTRVMLGNIWGTDTSNDHFVDSHGVATPDELWRVHVYDDHPNQAFAWIIPNAGSPLKTDPEQPYRVTLNELKKRIGDEYELTFPPQWRDGQGHDPHTHTRCSLK